VFEDFLFFDQDWLYNQYSHLEFVKSVKYYTFKTALNLFLQNNGKLIVETGTQRMIDDPGGCSTTLFGAFCKRYNKRLITVDNNPKNIEVSKEATKEFRDHIEYVLSDSVDFLMKFNEPIDLLYLDSMDCPLPPADATESQMHQLNELKAAYNKLHPGSIYLGDDNNFSNGGKTRLAKKFLIKSGEWVCIFDGGQSLWLKVK
jgi:SAM-dependent methyltransferase